MPLFQSESKCETILKKMTLICMEMKLQAGLIFIRKVSHLDSFWQRHKSRHKRTRKWPIGTSKGNLVPTVFSREKALERGCSKG